LIKFWSNCDKKCWRGQKLCWFCKFFLYF